MSEFNVITTITVTDAILTGSNVPEVDLQEFSLGTAYTVGDTVMVATSTANIHKTYQNKVAQGAGLIADILDENCTSISGWTDNDILNGVSELSPAGQFKFNAGAHSAGTVSGRYKNTGATIPDKFSMEVKLYNDLIGAAGDDFRITIDGQSNWQFVASFRSDGLFITKAGGAVGEVGTNIVKCNSAAAWQYFRFQVNKTTEASATCEVFSKEEGGAWVSQGSVDCDYEPAVADNLVFLQQYGTTVDNCITHVDYIKIATETGTIGLIADTSSIPVGSTSWIETGSTNRWKTFNSVLGSQTEQATKIEYILTPGAVIDSVALLNLESDTVDIVEINNADNLITNGESWTGATGTTPPTGWTKNGSPSDFTIDNGALRITTAGAGEGIYQTVNVTPGTEMQLLGKYKNTVGDIAQYQIYDFTHSALIVASVDLASSTTESIFSNVFTVPAGCTQVSIYCTGKSTGDIVFFDSVKLAPTEYSENVTTGTNKTSVVKTDIPQIATGILTVTINKSGTAAIGEFIIGTKTSLGNMRPKPQIGFRNLSTLEEDIFGNVDIVKRGYKKKLICNISVPMTSMDTVDKFLCDHKDDMMVYAGSENYSCLQLYGFAKEPNTVLGETMADMSLEIWSVI